MVVPEACDCHELPVFVRLNPAAPTATQVPVAGHATARMFWVVPDASAAQFTPLLVDSTVPRLPTATQSVAVEQLTLISV